MTDTPEVNDIPTPKAGRELDALVAEKVMGYSSRIEDRAPRFSSDIAAAWKVHLQICERPFSVRRRYYLALQEDATADLERAEDATVRVAWPDVLTVLRQRFPESVCLAALKAVGSP